MRKRHLAIILTVTIALIGLAGVILAPSALARTDYPLPETGEEATTALRGQPRDAGPRLRAETPKYVAKIEQISDEVDLPPLDRATAAYTVGDTLTWIALDEVDPLHKNFYGDMFEADYEVKFILEDCEVWVQTDLNYYNADGTLNSLHPDAKDPFYVTDERIAYLADQCSNSILPTDVAFFGPYLSRDGTFGYEALLNYYYGTSLSEVDGQGDRIVILVSNVRDDNFYDPIADPSFIMGFYWGAYAYFGDRNFITIDVKAWDHFVGDSGTSGAYEYEGTIAHELQHLIHADLSPNEESWVNEGMSGFAEFLNGYWYSENLGGRTTWQMWPENSLTLWGDQNGDQGTIEVLADYQLTNAFMLYTTGRIGGSYTDTAKLTRETTDGIVGFNNWLSDTAATNPSAVGLTFDILFDDFRIAMLHGGTTDDTQPSAWWNGDFIGSYESPLEKAGGPATSGEYLGLLRDSLNREAYDWPGVPAFGTDFVEICWSTPLSSGSWNVTFAGEGALPTDWSPMAATDIYSPSAPASGDALYSDHTHSMDNMVVYGPVTVGGSDELTFDHYYNIEATWDFGFVQVTTDTTGMTGWTSLALAGTTSSVDPYADPIIIANVPGFSGFSGGWLTATYDIGADYDGEQILLAFRYSADGYTAGQNGSFPSGWAIDNVQIGSTTLTMGTVGAGRSIEEVRDASPDFSFEFLTWTDGYGVDVNNVYSVTLSPALTGTLDLAAIAASDAGFDEGGERGVLMISSKREIYDDLIHKGLRPAYADYSLTGLPPSICTSHVNLFGSQYAGEDVAAGVHVDNVGSSTNITATGPALVYVGIEIPDNTTFKESIGGGAYTTDLSAISGEFPSEPGIFWIGLVPRTSDFVVVFTTDPTLQDDEVITATAHFADGPVPDQYFEDDDAMSIVSAVGLTGFQVVDPVYPYALAQSSANVLNLSDSARHIRLTADIPADTTFAAVSGATDVVTSSSQVTVTKVVSAYADAGATSITFEWQLGPSYEAGDVVTSTATLVDLQTNDIVYLDDTAVVRDYAFRWYFPIIGRGD